MKCEDSLTKIEAYIHNKMSYRELEDFLEHVKECPDCYDELETYCSGSSHAALSGTY